MKEHWRGDLQRLQEEVNRLVEQSLNRIGNYWTNDGDMSPAADVYEFDDRTVVLVELPGVDKADIDVSLSGRLLTVSAEKKPQDLDEDNLVKGEIHFGRIKRTFELSCEISADAVEARLNNGILRLDLPKPREESRKIEIRIG